MSREIPQAIRAVAGLAATVLDEARRLPQTLPGLPVRVVGLAMQATMKLQQHYAGLVARGDELLTGIRGEDEPGLATFDEDLPEATPETRVHTSAFDRAGDDEAVDRAAAELVDDEVSGLPPEPSPEEVVEALQDITDEVQAADLTLPEPGLTTEDALETALLEADGAPDTALVDGGTTETALVDADLIAESPTTPATPVTAEAPADDAGPAIDAALPGETPDVATDIDVLTPDGEIATVEGTVTDEGVAAPETLEAARTAATPEGDTAVSGATGGEAATGGAVTEQEARVDEALGSEADAEGTSATTSATEAVTTGDADATGSGDEVVTAEGTRVDDALGGADTAEEAPAAEQPAVGDTTTGPTPGDAVVATDEGGTPVAAATGGGQAEGTQAGGGQADGAQGAEPVQGYDSFTVAQLRGRLRGYQAVTVQELLAYEESHAAREPYLRMLRNRLEKLDRQAVESSPLAPRGA
ncbi:hypothetical protein ACI78V_14985 [Geodermatophilus sp. SYSU D00742]